LFAVITGTVSFIGGIVIGLSVASVAYLLHWLYHKKRRGTNTTAAEVPTTRTVEYEEIESYRKKPKAIELQDNSAYGKIKN